MKDALKSKKMYIIAAILTLLGFIPFIVAICMYYFTVPFNPFESYVYILMAIVATFLLLGYVLGDLHNANYRRKNKAWDDPLPDEVKASSWKRRLTFFIPAILLLLLVVILEIIFLVTGGYPFI